MNVSEKKLNLFTSSKPGDQNVAARANQTTVQQPVDQVELSFRDNGAGQTSGKTEQPGKSRSWLGKAWDSLATAFKSTGSCDDGSQLQEQLQIQQNINLALTGNLY